MFSGSFISLIYFLIQRVESQEVEFIHCNQLKKLSELKSDFGMHT